MNKDIKDIMQMIPHRYPFLLIDKVEDIVKGESARGIKNVTINEPFFQGHFPGHPVMPGVLIIEAMAQTSAVLVVETTEGACAGAVVYFTSIDNVKFRKPVVPGDVIHFEAKITKNRRNLWKFDVDALVDGEVVTSANISAMIMDEIDNSKN